MNTNSTQSAESKRLEALKTYRILDSLPESDYDAITQLATLICQTPMALLSFVDEQREWVKANYGLAVWETERQHSFCAQTIVDPTAPLIIQDVRLDERFAQNPLVTGEPRIVFYAGVPLVDPDGYALGSLCVIDTKVRHLSDEQLAALIMLTRQVINLLVLRKTNEELKALLKGEQQSRDLAHEQTQMRLELTESEALFRSLIEEAPVATMLMVGPTHTISMANQRMIAMLGKGSAIIGQPATQAVPELVDQVYLQLLDKVYQSGIPFEAKASPGELVVEGVPKRYYFDFTYKPIRNNAGAIYAIMSMAIDVTEQVEARHHLEQLTAQMRTMIESAPFPIGVYTGREMQIRFANQAIIDVYGKGPDVIGKSYLELLPELAGQQVFEQLLNVYETGIPFASGTQRVNIEHQGQLVPYYFNYNFTPLFDAQGLVYGVMNTAADVTPLELARQQVEVTVAALQNAVELAELGNFSVDVATNLVTISPRVADWLGFDSLTADANAFIAGVGEEDREQVRASLQNTLIPSSDGRYDVIHSIFNAKTGQHRILHALGQAYFDAAGKPFKIEVTAQDVTLERELQVAMAQQVQQRTEELAAANSELATLNQDLEASNEEYAALNEELTASGEEIEEANRGLEEANLHLLRSNQNLEQFAYIASHDLQEPLRKIQQFGDLLKTRYATSGEELVYLERMQLAASRMSLLIKDLLAFSRISTSQVITEEVNLNQVIDQVLDNLSVLIGETRSQIQLDPLPTLRGDATQLTQLFQNLLSNAIKFSSRNASGQPVIPQIRIRVGEVSATDLADSLKPSRSTTAYYRIDVTDNGIGFEEKYADRIFQVFQRLHGKNEFAGTGVGLAIVQKVVTNHAGVITATSQPGQGASFSIYLPK